MPQVLHDPKKNSIIDAILLHEHILKYRATARINDRGRAGGGGASIHSLAENYILDLPNNFAAANVRHLADEDMLKRFHTSFAGLASIPPSGRLTRVNGIYVPRNLSHIMKNGWEKLYLVP